MDQKTIRENGLDLSYIIDAYTILKEQGMEAGFFRRFFDLLMGQRYIREMIEQGATAAEIKAQWQADVESFKQQRKPYLLYEE